eukprot:TRINITY_DN8383_c0_g1_i1.p1 TRINITY_DN8383_c0_g1~~TRINITY_DN8383_c0_g1_i1.p1  ORF type:complete len:426 (-),score=34.26 TRINITY_DN8383_c0_g1_i1:133-1410(-)
MLKYPFNPSLPEEKPLRETGSRKQLEPLGGANQAPLLSTEAPEGDPKENGNYLTTNGGNARNRSRSVQPLAEKPATLNPPTPPARAASLSPTRRAEEPEAFAVPKEGSKPIPVVPEAPVPTKERTEGKKGKHALPSLPEVKPGHLSSPREMVGSSASASSGPVPRARSPSPSESAEPKWPATAGMGPSPQKGTPLAGPSSHLAQLNKKGGALRTIEPILVSPKPMAPPTKNPIELITTKHTKIDPLHPGATTPSAPGGMVSSAPPAALPEPAKLHSEGFHKPHAMQPIGTPHLPPTPHVVQVERGTANGHGRAPTLTDLPPMMHEAKQTAGTCPVNAKGVADASKRSPSPVPVPAGPLPPAPAQHVVSAHGEALSRRRRTLEPLDAARPAREEREDPEREFKEKEKEREKPNPAELKKPRKKPTE